MNQKAILPPPEPNVKRDRLLDSGSLLLFIWFGGLPVLAGISALLAGRLEDAALGISILAVGLIGVVYRAFRIAKRPYTEAGEEWEKNERARWHEHRLMQRDGMMKLSPRGFEEATALLFNRMGLRATTTRATGDGGWDVDVYDKDNKRILVECKQHSPDKKVGRPVLQKLHSAMITEGADSAMLITTASFTKPAREFASRHRIKLVDGVELGDMLGKVYADSKSFEVRGLCRICARTVTFGPVCVRSPFDGQVDTSEPLRPCPKGHMVKHPLAYDWETHVKEAKRRAREQGKLIG